MSLRLDLPLQRSECLKNNLRIYELIGFLTWGLFATYSEAAFCHWIVLFDYFAKKLLTSPLNRFKTCLTAGSDCQNQESNQIGPKNYEVFERNPVEWGMVVSKYSACGFVCVGGSSRRGADLHGCFAEWSGDLSSHSERR